MSKPAAALVAILPCNDLDVSEAFYGRLGFSRPDAEKPLPGMEDRYRMLTNADGAALHLTDAVEGWLVPGRNPFGLYLYTENVAALAAAFGEAVLGSPKDRRTNRGACTSSRCRTRTRHWCGWAGRAG